MESAAPPNTLGGTGDSSADGFTLVEVVVALMLTVLVMIGTAGFFVRGLAATRLMQQRQSSVAVAQQAMERVRSMPLPALAVLAANPPSQLTGGPTLTATTDPAYRVGNINYVVRTTVAVCELPPGGGECGPVTTSANMFRLDVTVEWSPAAVAKCSGPGGRCVYAVSTLRDPIDTSGKNLQEIPS